MDKQGVIIAARGICKICIVDGFYLSSMLLCSYLFEYVSLVHIATIESTHFAENLQSDI